MALTKVPSNLDATVATTQAASDNSTNVATTAYVTTAISNLVDSSPSALNTLNELAAALNDDASFSTTVNNSIATKAPLASPTFTSNINGGDGVELRLGDSQDILFKHHAGGYGHLENKTGTLYMDSETFTIRTDVDDLGTALFIDASQQVGIGTTSPAAKLNVEWTGSQVSTDNIARITAPIYPSLEFYSTNSNSGNRNWKIAGVHNSYGTLEFLRSSAAGGVANVTTLTMNSAGNIGIGTHVPEGRLHVYGGDSGSSYSADGADKLIIEHNDSVAIDLRTPASNQALIMFSDGTRSQGLIGYNHSNDSLRFSNNGNLTRMLIDSSGRVGINRTPAISNSKLEVGGADNVPLINVEASGATAGIGIGGNHFKIYYGTTEHWSIDHNGWIKINGGNAQQYSDNQRTYSGSENITFSSSSSAQTWTSGYYQPYQKFNFAGLHFGYSGNGAISQHFYITLMNHYSGLSINTQHSASGGSGSSYHTISFTSGGAYNTRTLKVVCTPASGQNAANTSGTIYYGTCI